MKRTVRGKALVLPPEEKRALLNLDHLWQRELRAVQEAHRQERNELTFSERVRRGSALKNLRVHDSDAGIGGRVLLWLSPSQGGQQPDHARFSIGTPVLLWRGSPESEETERGLVARRKGDMLGVMVNSQYKEFIDHGNINIDKEAPETTFQRGTAAIQQFAQDRELSRLRSILFGQKPPEFDEPGKLEFRDENLDSSQHAAVSFALSARDIALIHGPPGTGKTRTLVEIVKQALKQRKSVLVSAASHAAVDNLAERLIDAKVRPLRLGHPARVSASLESRTLDALVEQTEEQQQAKRWLTEAGNLRTRYAKKQARGNLAQGTGREMLTRARKLQQDANAAMNEARARVLRRTRCVCTTAAGIDDSLLGDTKFDLVILDEATQAQDPIALAALRRGGTVIMAGDPMQLSPTVVDREAANAGLGTTFFERKAAAWGERGCRMLTVQYRMHEALMAFPSQSMYGGLLEADSSVRARTLEQLEHVEPDLERSEPWLFFDCAGTGWQELADGQSRSVTNPEQSRWLAREAQKLATRGLSPRDIAVITPYSAQVRLYKECLAELVAEGLEIGTVDGFQGREKEAILVDLVRSNKRCDIGFLSDVRRTNVALTRAKRFLLVVGDGATLQKNEYYRNLIDFAHKAGAWRSVWENRPKPS